MNYIVISSIIIAIVVIALAVYQRETFVERFGFSGYTKPVRQVVLDDPKPDLTGYEKVEAKVDNEMMENFVLQANKELSQRAELCSYIIETTAVNHYTRDGFPDVHECMFMAIKKDGFAFGISVVASFLGGKLVSLRSQPLDVDDVSNLDAFVNETEGKEFVDYKVVSQGAMPTKSELDSIKIKLT